MAKESPSLSSSMSSVLRAYAAPIFIFVLAMFFQLFLLPRSFPTSHYDVLGVKTYGSVDDVREAYEAIASKWNSDSGDARPADFIKIQYAYELLTNPVWKRDYDLYAIDESLHITEELEKQYAMEDFAKIKTPLLEAVSYGFMAITSQDFASKFQDSKPWLIQLYSSGSNSSAQFSMAWRRIVDLLDGVANHAMVELGDVRLVTYLAEKKTTGQVLFRNGLPSIVAFPPQCKTADCLIRFEGELSTDAVTDWFATTVLELPRVFYHTKETLVPKFLAKVPPNKVRVILFSQTGERATPSVRQAAKDYWNFASLTYVLWREEDASFWWNALEVESAPAMVIMKDPGLKPVVYHGSGNRTWFLDILEQNKQLQLPQLSSTTSMELGCDARGYSRAGFETATWYCAVLVGRQSTELNKMRETMCRVQDALSNHDESDEASKDPSVAPAASAHKNKRLTLAWLDGEVQSKYCFFYVQSETSYDTCGTRKSPIDVPRILIIRYHRNATESANVEKKSSNWPKTVWESEADDVDPAAQLVVSYDGPAETPEIIKWLSKMVEDGDSKNLPFYRAKTPELVPESTEPMRSGVPKSVKATQALLRLWNRIKDYLADPRMGPTLLLGALLSAGSVWLTRSRAIQQPVQTTQQSSTNQSDNNTEEEKKKERKRRNAKGEEAPASITDNEPKDAVQILSSGSDSD
ncbi:dnaJ homolog subfamily C member 16-like isoform X2 [Brassica napus]|uniref:dnaJ homolog subfamily C member 16-like isoform X2 n=1 Tax=Brassica napus TaxID=3708 RepID=UPI0006AA6FD5|nr:dnaJ homolog subfamily C member 16-like isoform X2 [Brassica napus]